MFTNAEKQKAKSAKTQMRQWLLSQACADFKMKYPNADLSRFEAQVYFDLMSYSFEIQIYFKHSNGVETSVSGSTEDIGVMK